MKRKIGFECEYVKYAFGVVAGRDLLVRVLYIVSSGTIVSKQLNGLQWNFIFKFCVLVSKLDSILRKIDARIVEVDFKIIVKCETRNNNINDNFVCDKIVIFYPRVLSCALIELYVCSFWKLRILINLECLKGGEFARVQVVL